MEFIDDKALEKRIRNNADASERLKPGPFRNIHSLGALSSEVHRPQPISNPALKNFTQELAKELDQIEL
jgi:hypothetical protein